MDNYIEILLGITLISTLALAISTRKRKSSLYKLFKTFFLLLSLHIVVLMLLLYFKNFITNPDFLMHIDNLSYISTCNLPVILYFIALKYDNKDVDLYKYKNLFIIPVISLIIIFTNQYHHLFSKNYSINVSEVVLGPYFYVHMIYTYALMIAAFVKIIRVSIKKAGFLTLGTILIIIGACVPIVPNILASLQLISMDTYVTPILFLILAIFFYISIFKLNSFDAVPLALRSIVDIMTDAFIVVEKDGTMTYCNKAFTDYLSKFMKIGLGDNFYEVIKKDKKLNLLDFKKTIDKTKKSQKFSSYDWSFINKSEEKYYEVNLQPVFAPKGNHSFIGTLIIFKDISQHVLDMKTIQNNQEMLMERERLASLGQLIGGIAHNLKTPIMSIAGAAQGLTDLVKEYDTSLGDSDVTLEDHHAIAKDMSEWIGKIKSYSEYMSDVITAVKGQAVTLSEEQVVSFDVEELVKRIDILMRHELKNALVTLNKSINVDTNTILHGNIVSLVQVINNMISNSIQAYNGESGKSIDFSISKEGNNLVISIKDYAGGLPKDVESKLFKEMITTKGKNGTGLGLFMSYSTIRAHFNGNITFESKENVGTTFNIILPCN